MATLHRVFFTGDDRATLKAIIGSGARLARYQTKARIVLQTDRNRADRLTDNQIIAALGTSSSTIQRTRISFLKYGFPGCLEDKPRSGRKPTITGDIQAKIVVIACSEPPVARKTWTLQLIAEEAVRQTLYCYVAPDGAPREDGVKLLHEKRE